MPIAVKATIPRAGLPKVMTPPTLPGVRFRSNLASYTGKAKDLHYKGGELLDAFVFANFDIGDVAGNVRIGRHTLYWGQSFLVAGALHGFAGSMATIDFSKGLGTPGTEVKELFIPNGKVSSTLQFTNDLSLSGYYAYDFEPVRWPECGTYFATNEVASKGCEFVTGISGDDSPTLQGQDSVTCRS